MYNSSNAPHPAFNNVQVLMDVSHTQAPYNRQQYSDNNAYTNATITQLQEEASRQSHPKGPCFNCRKPGHFARDCHSNPSSNIDYMDMVEDDMQYIPQPTVTPRTNVANLKAQIDSLSTEDNDTLIEMMGLT